MSLRTLSLILVVIILAACNSSDDVTPTPRPPVVPPTATMPPVITVIVPAPPTPTNTPAPTLSFDIMPVAGRWALSFDMQMLNASVVKQLTYAGAADFQVRMDGTIAGTGYFSQNINAAPCDGRVLDTDALTFTVQGYAYPQDNQIWADVQIIPDDPGRLENYAVICPELFNDVQYRNQPILWPILSILGKLEWRVALQSNQNFPFQADLAQATGGQYDGIFSAEVVLNRY